METKNTMWEGDQRLDNMSKILLATSTINYMANSVSQTLQDYYKIKLLNPDADAVIDEAIESMRGVLDSAVSKLSGIVEEIADYQNGCDMVCAIDERVTRPACDILLLGKDLVEENYDSEEAPFS